MASEPALTSAVCLQLALANILISPLNMLPVCINGLVEALVSVRRVQRYLAAPEVCSHLPHSTRLFSCEHVLS